MEEGDFESSLSANEAASICILRVNHVVGKERL